MAEQRTEPWGHAAHAYYDGWQKQVADLREENARLRAVAEAAILVLERYCGTGCDRQRALLHQCRGEHVARRPRPERRRDAMSGQYATCPACSGSPQPDPQCWACDGAGVLPYMASPRESEHIDTIQMLAVENSSLSAEVERMRGVLLRIEWIPQIQDMRFAYCPACFRSQIRQYKEGYHTETCPLGRALGRPECGEGERK